MNIFRFYSIMYNCMMYACTSESNRKIPHSENGKSLCKLPHTGSFAVFGVKRQISIPFDDCALHIGDVSVSFSYFIHGHVYGLYDCQLCCKI